MTQHERLMYEWDAARAQCWVNTTREGVLKRVGHDLRIVVERFRLRGDAEERRITLEVESGSLNVDCAVEDGRCAPNALSTKDRATINEQMHQVVLRSASEPSIRFVSEPLEGGAWDELVSLVEGKPATGNGSLKIPGQLTLRSTTAPVTATVHSSAEGVTGRVELDQTHFGITPYRGMLGALRVSAAVEIWLRIPRST